MKQVSLVALACAVALSGCGSIINGSTQNMSVQTTPSNANISLLSSSGALITQSQGSLFYNLKRSDGFFNGANYNLKIEADGYNTQIIPLTSSASGWYLAGNILLGGLIGWLIVDPATGGMWAIEAENTMDIENLKVVLLKDVDEAMMDKAIKISNAQ